MAVHGRAVYYLETGYHAEADSVRRLTTARAHVGVASLEGVKTEWIGVVLAAVLVAAAGTAGSETVDPRNPSSSRRVIVERRGKRP